MSGNTLAEIAAALRAADSVLLFPHVSADGDALGSATALCAAMRRLGKIAYVVLEDDIPETLRFLDKGFCSGDLKVVERPDLCLCVDCGEFHRFPKRKELFKSGAIRVCVDHHASTRPFADLNYIDGGAAAAAEIVYDLLALLGVAPDGEIGEAIYAGIVTDTGKFQYSNTTRRTHLIAADLYARGVPASEISIKLYQNVSREKLLLESRIMRTLELFAGGRAALACMTEEMLADTGAKAEESDGVVEKLRDIRGVEAACLLKEKKGGQIKVSLRSKQALDVAALSASFGGGGHARAAGYTAKGPVEAAKAVIKDRIERLLTCGLTGTDL
jgi:phosphoesterase RecJ-like protein